MKIYTSYFYMIRFFNQNMIPLSTAISDPKWYHAFNKNNYIFYDRRGVLNGLRIEPLHPMPDNSECAYCNRSGDPNTCSFIRKYREQIYSIDFEEFQKSLEKYLNIIRDRYMNGRDIIPVLIFHEAPDNPCSERTVIHSWLSDNGVEFEELTKTAIVSLAQYT